MIFNQASVNKTSNVITFCEFWATQKWFSLKTFAKLPHKLIISDVNRNRCFGQNSTLWDHCAIYVSYYWKNKCSWKPEKFRKNLCVLLNRARYLEFAIGSIFCSVNKIYLPYFLVQWLLTDFWLGWIGDFFHLVDRSRWHIGDIDDFAKGFFN